MLDASAIHTIVVTASMGLVVLLSPEIVVLGLFMAANRTSPRRNTALFCLGAIIGLAFVVAAGAWITLSAQQGPPEPSWHVAIVKACLGTALLALGAYRAGQWLFGAKPMPKLDAGAKSGLRTFLEVLFPSMTDRPHRQGAHAVHYFLSAFVIGFVSAGLNPKVLPLGLLVGHRLHVEASERTRVACGLVFGAIALLPWVFPLALAMITPGAAVAMKAWLGRTMERHGHWIAALICGAFGVHMWMDAVAAWPG